MIAPVIVDFPLQGEWTAPNTPGSKIPSHGVDIFGETYAYDFVLTAPESEGNRFYRSSPLRYLALGVPLQDCYGWGQPIFSATAGTVVQAADSWPERDPVHPLRDIANAYQNARKYGSGRIADFRPLAGNYVIVESQAGFFVYAHAQTGSVRVSTGETVVPGQHLANVGHSGNSTAPHLHFHLMDHPDPNRAHGILCGFRRYEVLQDGAWQPVENGIPKSNERIRML